MFDLPSFSTVTCDISFMLPNTSTTKLFLTTKKGGGRGLLKKNLTYNKGGVLNRAYTVSALTICDIPTNA